MFSRRIMMASVINNHPVSGAYLGTTAANLKKNGKPDLVVIEFCEGSITAASFTQNAFCAAPVILAKNNLSQTNPRALLINAGNANAGMGEKGLEDAKQTCQWLAEELGHAENEILPFSTGVIGEDMPMKKFELGLPHAIASLSITGWGAAAKAIMTTDLAAKQVSKQIEVDGALITITGMSKGSGMIHPNMATMLGFVVTDARISQLCLQQALNDAVKLSFNRITVDGDTSTNDACTLTATQQADMTLIDSTDSVAYQSFAKLVLEVMTELALMIVRDGEGATKFVTIEVNEGNSSDECLQVANTVALSPLVKTALFASDPNWGRILAAVGRSGLDNLDINTLEIYLGEVCIVKNGGRYESYTEEAGQIVMNKTDIKITINLKRGQASATIWTTDFSYDYVKINAEYRS